MSEESIPLEQDCFNNAVYKLHIPTLGWRALLLQVTKTDEDLIAGTCKVVFPSDSKFVEERFWSYSTRSGLVRLFRTAKSSPLMVLSPDKTELEWSGRTTDGKPALFKMHHGEFLARKVRETETGSNPIIVGAELGVHQGFMSRVLLDKIPNLELHMVDLWGVHPDDSAFVKSGDLRSRHSWKDYNDNLLLARRRVRQHTWHAHIHVTSTHAASKLFNDEALNFVFIDGDHSFEGCYQDMQDWWSKVRPGGIFSGHDYNYHPKGMKIEVTQAVDQFLKEQNRTADLRLGPSCVWWLVK